MVVCIVIYVGMHWYGMYWCVLWYVFSNVLVCIGMVYILGMYYFLICIPCIGMYSLYCYLLQVHVCIR